MLFRGARSKGKKQRRATSLFYALAFFFLVASGPQTLPLCLVANDLVFPPARSTTPHPCVYAHSSPRSQLPLLYTPSHPNLARPSLASAHYHLLCNTGRCGGSNAAAFDVADDDALPPFFFSCCCCSWRRAVICSRTMCKASTDAMNTHLNPYRGKQAGKSDAPAPTPSTPDRP